MVQNRIKLHAGDNPAILSSDVDAEIRMTFSGLPMDDLLTPTA
jgi:hypothetical protein